MKRKALILGASGLVGGNLLELLLDSGEYETVAALVRKPVGKSHGKLREYIVDFNRLEDFVELFRVDDIYCCLGTTIKQAKTRENFRRVDYTYVVEAARLGSRMGARQFLVVTALGADARSKIFYNRVKGEVERDVSSLPFGSVHIFRPSLLLGDRGEKRPGEAAGTVLYGIFSFIFSGPLRKYRAIQAATVARAMISAAGEGLSGVNIHDSQSMQLRYEREGTRV
ncbi:MAG: oxidoreductase [Spirochaetae bacterium HGW-Spirochaetae-1]|jgi:uncharacterized protein YbjT (DUF2867 family)|nr:MAG: oxidoreductase [Spirochaetae bacterium HGW-Spirochaetae-1]